MCGTGPYVGANRYANRNSSTDCYGNGHRNPEAHSYSVPVAKAIHAHDADTTTDAYANDSAGTEAYPASNRATTSSAAAHPGAVAYP